MKIPLAKEGYIFFVPVGILAFALAALSFYWAAGVFFLLFLFIVNFFRDPNRIVPQEKNAIISPADGKVVEIVKENDPFTNQPSTRVSVFLNVFDVHINRIPISGRIENLTYNKGKFLNAASPKASLDNEQTALLIDNGKHKVVVKQIAGLIARRIVCWAKIGDEFKSGERFGLIRFGSRADIFVPEGTRLTVSLGDRVAGGADIIGYLPE
ncbi:MAG: phosphatidylserine decarboxylase family protein [Nitrospinales bacterium]